VTIEYAFINFSVINFSGMAAWHHGRVKYAITKLAVEWCMIKLFGLSEICVSAIILYRLRNLMMHATQQQQRQWQWQTCFIVFIPGHGQLNEPLDSSVQIITVSSSSGYRSLQTNRFGFFLICQPLRTVCIGLWCWLSDYVVRFFGPHYS